VKVVGVAFDGVIYSVVGSPSGVLSNAPVPGAFLWLEDLLARHSVVIVSYRAETFDGRVAMSKWMRDNGAAATVVQGVEFHASPIGDVYIGPAAVNFTGEWPDPDRLDTVEPYWRSEWAPETAVGEEIEVSVSSDDDGVHLCFNRAIAAVCLPADKARALCALLAKHSGPGD
jgi:hypothetical protein